MSLSMPPHLPSTRTGRMKEFQSRPATPGRIVGERAHHAGDARAMPAAVGIVAAAERGLDRSRR
jgi:hypothetical protein